MGALDPDIANGTCYYAYNEAAGSELVPCGNAGIAYVPCCFAGDYCDSSNTCYDKDTGNTYLAGCTDPEYTSSSCPWKSDDFASQEWVGLVRCGAVNETQDEWAWAGCSVPESAYTSPRRLGSCDCAGKATLFVDEQALLRHASLPGAVGGSISWVSGYEVTAAASASASATGGGSGAGTGLVTATAGSTADAGTGASTAAASSASSTGVLVLETGSGGGSLSAGAKAGIAVGSVGAVLSVLAVAVAVFLHRRRRRGGGGGGGGGNNDGGVDGYSPVVAAEQAVDGGAGAMVAPPAYTGFKTELPANEPVMPKGVQTQTPSPLLLGVTPELGSSEFRGSAPSMVSELSSDEGADRSRLNSPVYPTMVSIAELQG